MLSRKKFSDWWYVVLVIVIVFMFISFGVEIDKLDWVFLFLLISVIVIVKKLNKILELLSKKK